MKISSLKGITIVEIIIASAILSISIIGIVGAIQIYLKIVHQNAREAQAVLVLDETAEAIQYMRDISFDTHIGSKQPNTQYTIFWNGTGYEFSTSTILLSYEMTSKIMFENVQRDTNDQIVLSGGVTDENTKKAIITISWPYQNDIKILTSEMLIHNIYEN